MYIDAVSANSVAICVSGNDINTSGLRKPIGVKLARELVRKTLRERGENPWLDMELDMFTHGDTVLLLARPLSGDVQLFHFDSAEALIEAAASCRDSITSSLYTLGEQFFLILRCRGTRLPMQLFEYGKYVTASEELYVHIREHGNCLIHYEAIDTMKELFSAK